MKPIIIVLALLLSACGRPPEASPQYSCTESLGGSCINGASRADMAHLIQLASDMEPGALYGLRFEFGTSCVWVVEGQTFWGSRDNLARGLRVLVPGCLEDLEPGTCEVAQ